MWMTKNRAESPGSAERPPGRWRKLLRRAGGVLLVSTIVAGGFVMADAPEQASALPRGEQMSFPGGTTISNFKLPNGKRAYCIEVAMGEPSGVHSAAGRVTSLPGRPGMFSAYTDKTGMRMMNFIIDKYGQSDHVGNSVSTQLAVWAIRGDSQYYSVKVPALQQSAQGREALQTAQNMINDAKVNAKAPVAPKKVTGKLVIKKDPSGKFGRYLIEYPKGVEKLTVKNGTFVRNGLTTIEVSTGSASSRYFDVKIPGQQVSATAEWVAKGTKGYEPVLEIYNTATAAGAVGQRVAVATGTSVAKNLTGTLTASAVNTAPPMAPPRASSQAQPSADVGGTMTDTLIVASNPNTTVEMWPNAIADFTAYLKPEVGAAKVNESWDPIMSPEYDAQAEDPATGELQWTTWWATADGSPLLDAAGAKIPTTDVAGAATTGTAADGTAYPVQELDDAGQPVVDGAGNPVYLTGRDPVMEKRQDAVTWTAEELAGMTAAQQCVAQPIYREGGIAVKGVGNYTTQPVPVKSAGTIHWVERITSSDGVVHQGRCGVANETTKVALPAVITQAVPTVMLGEEVYDVATVSGTLAPGVNYQIRAEAFQAPAEDPANPEVVEPLCDASNRIFRSDMVAVPTVGDYRLPGFTSLLEHGTKIWWVESLYIVPANGEPQRIHQGECGLENETTRVSLPEFVTKSTEAATSGDLIGDTLIASGEFASNAGAQWESTFAAYRPAFTEIPNQAATVAPGSEMVEVPACTPDNLLVETGAIAVPGPGEHTSELVVSQPEWAGDIWWVETVTLIQGETRTVFHTGECGLTNETTKLVNPVVVTDATGFAVIGDMMNDVATITGPVTQREGVVNEVIFEGYRGDATLTGTDNAVCNVENKLFTTDAVAVPAEFELVDGVETRKVTSPDVRALPDMGDTIWWIEKMVQREGEEVRTISEGKCGLDNETTKVTQPKVRTESAGTVTVGENMYDTAIVDGKFPKATDVEFTVTFKAYRNDQNEQLVCSTKNEIKDFEDATGVMVDKPGKYRSKEVKTTTEHVGLGGYVETLEMRVDGEKYVVSVGKCGASSEKFEVKPPNPPFVPPLVTTGGAGMTALLIGGVALLLVGAAAVSITIRRQKLAAAGVPANDAVSSIE